MAKSVNKTQRTSIDPVDFIAALDHDVRREDAYRLVDIMREETGEEPYMYGPSIVGFGTYHYKYESGRKGDAPLAAFSPRKAQMVVYLLGDYENKYPQVLAKIGKYKPGKSCFYFSKLDNLDEDLLRYLIKDGYETAKAEYSGC